MPRTKLNNESRKEHEVHVKSNRLPKAIEKSTNLILAALDDYNKRQQLRYANIANITIGEFNKNGGLPNTTATSSIQHIMDRTKNTTKQNSRFLSVRRSNSFDEGYRTAGSSNGAIATTGERESRPRGRPLKTRRLSRSMSPNNNNNTNNNKCKFVTPFHRPPPTTYGIVTPKVNPNTPQVLLRRPKDGEMVLSLQGSPLYTGAVPMDQVANINIPLHDGKLLTLQPHRGLRLSQIPELDPNTAQQLKTLRDNLDKVCQATGGSKR